MNLNEFGLMLRKAFPDLEEVPLNNEGLAQRILNRCPKFYDAISSTARRVKEITEEEFESHRWFEQGRLESKGLDVQNKKAEIEMLHEADLIIKASGLGVSVPAMVEMEIATHQTNETIRIETFRMVNGLDGAERVSLKPHHLIARLEAELESLVDKRDRESHVEKRADLTESIEFKREELRARRQQALVQVGGGSGLRLVDKNPDGSGDSGESSEGNMESVPTAKSRVGF